MERYLGPLDVYQSTGANGATQDGVAVSGTTTYYSTKCDIKSLNNPSLDLYWGANVGVFTVQVSNKPAPVESSDADWKTLALATAIQQPTGSNTGDYIDLSGLPFRWVRLKYVNTSGTGTIHAYVAGKE